MLEFLDTMIFGGYLEEIFNNIARPLVYDNPLIICVWVCLAGFGMRMIAKALFGGS